MSYNFILNNIDEFSYANEKSKSKIELPKDLGYMNFAKENISDEIYIMKNDIFAKEDFNMFAQSSNKDLIIKISLQSDGKYDDYILNKNENLKTNNIQIAYTNNSKGVFTMKKNTLNKGLAIGIKESFLEKNLFNNLQDKKRKEIETNYNKNIPTILKSTLANPRMIFLANEIYNCPYNGVLQDIYLQSKVYEIIYNEFLSLVDNTKKTDKKNEIKLTKEDIEALHKAKEIILTNKKSFGIIELSRKVAINENKLKYGFKHIFNTTPGNIMLEAKMYEAKKLLEESELNITEISQKIGYKYIQSFTVAFTKYFGTNPKVIMKNRKYYY